MTPALTAHCKTIYALLKDESKRETVDGHKLLVFRGSLNEAFRKSGVSQGYYTPVFRTLEDIGCITILQRGNRGAVSVAVLHTPPPDEILLTEQEKPAKVSPDDLEGIRKELRDIRQSLGGMNIVKALAELDKRLSKVENKVKYKEAKAKQGE